MKVICILHQTEKFIETLTVQLCHNSHVHIQVHNSELQIRGGIEDNSKIVFFYFSTKTYIVTPH